MKFFFTALAVLFAGLVSVFSQEVKPLPDPEKATITWNGFVKAESMFDTRQVVEAREGYLLLYPKKVSLDKNGNDINAHGSFNQYAMTARLALKATGPDILGAKVLAYVEGDFTGASNAENNSFRLRHAYVKLKWKHAGILAGQYWHPLNIPEMLPGVLSLNTGAPFHPYSRHPQIRLDASWGKINTVLVVASQRDFTNTGPAGASSVYLRNSVIPNLHGQIQYVSDLLFAGMAFDFKRLTPRLTTDWMYATHASVNCFSFSPFMMVKTKPVVFKMQLIYGQGLNDHTVMGGYGIKYTNPSTDEQEYSPLNYFSSWFTLSTTGKTWQGSLFAGYTKALGSKEIITGVVYARDADIGYIYRLAPMMTYYNGKLSIATEVEFTSCAYGKTDNKYKVSDALAVANTRVILSVGYNF